MCLANTTIWDIHLLILVFLSFCLDPEGKEEEEEDNTS